MSRDSLAERFHLAALVARQWLRTLAGRADTSAIALSYAPVPVPERLLIAPQDLRTGDPTLAAEIYAGRFAFAGKVMQLDGRTPFELVPASVDWAEALHGFGWLRHLHAANTTIARANARALVGDWIRNPGVARAIAGRPEVTARRVISWLTQATFLLQDAELDFYRRFMRSLARQVRQLRRGAHEAPDGYPRLLVILALTFAGLCMSDQGRLLKAAQRRLGEELDRQILPDGGPITRNPGMLIELLLDLLPLRQAFTARNQQAPAAVMNAVDRMMPMLRFFRHGDGAFAHFHGMSYTAADQLATILAFDDARGAPVANAPYSGYQRLDAKGAVVIADTGPPPPLSVSWEAHASCLAFEFSTGRNRLVVNCGVPAVNREQWRQVARSTAAHSTAVIADTSSCRFLNGSHLTRLMGLPIVDGPKTVDVQRGVRNEAILLRASHDGYAPEFGLIHQRSWRLALDGNRLDGEEVFRAAAEGAELQSHAFAIRFHLHPQVAVERFDDPHTALLSLPNGEAWAFAAPLVPVTIEESVYLAASGGPRRTSQLVLVGDVRDTSRIVWTFMRTREAQGGDLRGTYIGSRGAARPR
ncbi:heparinase II/III family protein [Xanthobacter agilis]|uniref:Heparinase superfamily protein n=1 Tax=Xanthobacter agilis TaxID=47492 RepID=A0ABU0LK57_XANAG|nr:heparinase II/III family protein [Xanthobacter agilis]MDQ0507503.1 putative heparinase superfamily protein [Xanthobacter agilis]